jgi:hypothetical protein
MEGFLGQYVIVRTTKAGVLCGRIKSLSPEVIVLEDARRLWYHKPLAGAWYEGCATYGVSESTKASETLPWAIIKESEFLIIPVSDVAEKSMREVKAYVV